MEKLRFVHVETTRHGKQVVYFRRGQGERIRLPALDSRQFKNAYAEALAGRAVGRKRALNSQQRRLVLIEYALRGAVKNAQARAAHRGLPFSLTAEWALDQAKRQGNRCALTGLPFLPDAKRESCKRPMAPSLDRIVPALGYTPENVRIVAFALNVMLSDWGQETFELVANAYRENAQSRTSIPAPIFRVRTTEEIPQ